MTHLTFAQLISLVEHIHDPDVLDYGSIEAACARHQAVVLGTECYPTLHAKAAALLQQLVRVPALANSNGTFGVAVSLTFLTMNGATVRATTREWGDLAIEAHAGTPVREIAARIRSWLV
jgi:prophage maintenance system killer protein